MDGLLIRMDRLYELYQEHFAKLRDDIVDVNRSLGSTQPEKTQVELLSRTEFEALLSASTVEPAVVQRWIRRIVRGHELEFPEVRVA